MMTAAVFMVRWSIDRGVGIGAIGIYGCMSVSWLDCIIIYVAFCAIHVEVADPKIDTWSLSRHYFCA